MPCRAQGPLGWDHPTRRRAFPPWVPRSCGRLPLKTKGKGRSCRRPGRGLKGGHAWGGLKASWGSGPSVAAFSRISGILHLTRPQPLSQSVAGPFP